MRAHIPAMVLALVALSAVAASQSSRRPASLVVSAMVTTEDSTHQILSPGAIGINGTDIVDVDRPDAIANRYNAADTSGWIG